MSLETFKISLSYSQILELVKQLPQKDKVKLSRELAREVKDKRLSRLLNSFRTDEISNEQIVAEVEEVRAELYGRKKKD